MMIKKLFSQRTVLTTMVGLLGWAPLASAKPPNIIYLMTDDQRADALGCMGNPIIATPHIDAMAEEGVVFENAFTTTAICMTSRACVLSGQYAARHGVWSFRTEFTPDQLGKTYLGQLKAAGYRTGFIGKWGVGHPRSAEAALDVNMGFPGQSRYFEGDVKKKQGQHLTAKLGDQALEFLEGCSAEQPFHLSVSFKSPHCQDSSDIYSDQFPSDAALGHLYSDLQVPFPTTGAPMFHDRMPEFLQNSMNRDRWAVRFRSPARFQQSVKDYYRLISGVDVVVGRIREALAESGLAENTIIVFTSDHGFFLSEFGFAGKWTPHELSIRVPLVVFDPRMEKANRGQRREEMALLIDMAPTMLGWAGVEVPSGMQGESLIPLVTGQEPENWRESFFYEHWFNAGGLIVPSEGIRNERWKYARYLVPGEEAEGKMQGEQLYDLHADPNETMDLAQNPEYAEVLEGLRSDWAKWREEVK